MKFSINVAFLAALNFGAVRSEKLTEDVFWAMYTEGMGSMSMSMSLETSVPTESPTLGEVSFVPVPTAAPVPITDPPTTDPPTVIEENPVSGCSPIGMCEML